MPLVPTQGSSTTGNNILQDIASFIASVGGTVVTVKQGLVGGGGGGVSASPSIVTVPQKSQENGGNIFILVGIALVITAIVAGFIFSK